MKIGQGVVKDTTEMLRHTITLLSRNGITLVRGSALFLCVSGHKLRKTCSNPTIGYVLIGIFSDFCGMYI